MGDSHFCESPIHSISGSQKQKIVNQGFTIFFSVHVLPSLIDANFSFWSISAFCL
jgi:hypothetical protein